MRLPEYRFTSTELADYLEKARLMMVLAERNRCAEIARSFVSWPLATKAGVVVATAIADAIENDATP